MEKIILTTQEELVVLIQSAVTTALTNYLREKPEDDKEQIMSVQGAADFLKLSVQTIYGHVHRRAIPVSKRGKRLYFSKLELLEWISEGRMKTHTEIEREARDYLNRRKKGLR